MLSHLKKKIPVAIGNFSCAGVFCLLLTLWKVHFFYKSWRVGCLWTSKSKTFSSQMKFMLQMIVHHYILFWSVHIFFAGLADQEKELKSTPFWQCITRLLRPRTATRSISPRRQSQRWGKCERLLLPTSKTSCSRLPSESKSESSQKKVKVARPAKRGKSKKRQICAANQPAWRVACSRFWQAKDLA